MLRSMTSRFRCLMDAFFSEHVVSEVKGKTNYMIPAII